mmetsp:Transcript_137524/g.383548  ORF Transcript_137524/g.383548 Transcript_137524/m.383548 type:complete len:222 (+) Transcript_137524:57-722(+)|eukprot:CAMPEP_0179088108 /NCGR_PEP_ID=MMETSP0796-20121207/40070_1 /TAXON_ID=73915 /ORGANISM="Pyrodinium bahamense, Strain pbaha01" /LENGTH=221 /DNA_ID=CAMNT_0020785629 /DNA_START=57 /DNA_END=722 /DNA_ORIENTATION=+
MAQHRNPFDNAFELMKELQGQVHELEAALEMEKQNRTNEVNELKSALAQERAERTALCQQMGQNIEHVSQRLNSAQDRIRFDMGDLRKALQKECDDRTENCNNLGQSLDTEAARLQSSLDALKALQASQYVEVTTASATTNHDWNEAVRNLNAKLDAQVRALSGDTNKVATDLAEFSRASRTMQAGVQHGVGVILESIKGFGLPGPQAGVAESRPTTASTS